MQRRWLKKPVPIEAWQYVGNENPDPGNLDAATHQEIRDMGCPIDYPFYYNNLTNDATPEPREVHQWDLLVMTPTGGSTLRIGDWIAREPVLNDAGERTHWDWWPIDGHQFHQTYELVQS